MTTTTKSDPPPLIRLVSLFRMSVSYTHLDVYKRQVNKDETAVRLRYHGKDADTGEAVEFLIENMETRSQLMNRENAMRILKSKLYQRELDKRMATQQALEASKKKIEWGSQIRSYVFDDRRVKDHRTGVQTSAVEAVMDGGLDEFIKAYLMEYGAEA